MQIEDCVSIAQWIRYGGGLAFSWCKNEKVRASISDPGGGAIGWIAELDSLEASLAWSEKKIGEIIQSNLEIVEQYKSGEIPWPNEAVIKIPGIPPLVNPHYQVNGDGSLP